MGVVSTESCWKKRQWDVWESTQCARQHEEGKGMMGRGSCTPYGATCIQYVFVVTSLAMLNKLQAACRSKQAEQEYTGRQILKRATRNESLYTVFACSAFLAPHDGGWKKKKCVTICIQTPYWVLLTQRECNVLCRVEHNVNTCPITNHQ